MMCLTRLRPRSGAETVTRPHGASPSLFYTRSLFVTHRYKQWLDLKTQKPFGYGTHFTVSLHNLLDRYFFTAALPNQDNKI